MDIFVFVFSLVTGFTYERLDGSVRGEERFLAVQNFNQNDETFVFLLSTKAGVKDMISSAFCIRFVLFCFLNVFFLGGGVGGGGDLKFNISFTEHIETLLTFFLIFFDHIDLEWILSFKCHCFFLEGKKSD